MNTTERMEYPAWEAIIAFQKDGKPITTEGVAAIEALVGQLRDVARKATAAQAVSYGRLRQVQAQSAAWHARFQQVKHENNALRKRLHAAEPFTVEELKTIEGYAEFGLDGLEEHPDHLDGPPALAKLERVIAAMETRP